VQLPTKFELIANLRTSKAPTFDIPPPLLSTADEVIALCTGRLGTTWWQPPRVNVQLIDAAR
jgi:hypothetical protein